MKQIFLKLFRKKILDSQNNKNEIFKGYEHIEDDGKKLVAFKDNFEKWQNEIKNLCLEDNFNFLDVYKYSKYPF